MSVGSPLLSNSIVGTADRGARSEKDDRGREGRVLGNCGGDDDGIYVEEVAISDFGKLPLLLSIEETRERFVGRGKDGDDDEGSNAGNSDGAERFVPTIEEPGNFTLLGEELIPSWVELDGPDIGLFLVWTETRSRWLEEHKEMDCFKS